MTERAMQAPGSLLPMRVDYVLVTVNQNEDRGVKTVFGLSEVNRVVESGLPYYWGCIEHSSGKSTNTVALVSLHDKPGGNNAALVTQRILSVLAPTYVLLLGTAGGISRERASLNPGDIFIPRVVHSGTLKHSSLRFLPIQQPSSELYDNALAIVTDNTWRTYIHKRNKFAIPDDYEPQVETGELVSTNVNFSGIGDPLLKQLLQEFPRMTAIEMEAGGAAHFLHNAAGLLSTTHVPGYLIIKGISDNVYNEAKHKSIQSLARDLVDVVEQRAAQKLDGVKFDQSVKNGLVRSLSLALAEPPQEDEQKTNQSQRDEWSPFASLASAAFAKYLIETFTPEYRLPTPYVRVWKPETRNTLRPFDGAIRTILGVDQVSYSKLAVEVLDRHAGGFDDKLHFFTVCAFSPTRLYQLLVERYRSDYNMSENDPDPKIKRLAEWAKQELIHFHRFAEHARQYKDRCARVLIVENLEKWPVELANPLHWELFLILNDDVPCWVIDRPNVKQIGFLTDYVILGEEILLDWYDEARFLNVGDMRQIPGSEYFLSLFEHFKENHDSFPYTRLDELSTQTTNALSTQSNS